MYVLAVVIDIVGVRVIVPARSVLLVDSDTFTRCNIPQTSSHLINGRVFISLRVQC